MKAPKRPAVDEARILRRFRAVAEAAEDARKIAEAILEFGGTVEVSRQRAAGDAHTLRGIPVAGVPGGLGGAVAESRPGVSRQLDQWPNPD